MKAKPVADATGAVGERKNNLHLFGGDHSRDAAPGRGPAACGFFVVRSVRWLAAAGSRPDTAGSCGGRTIAGGGETVKSLGGGRCATHGVGRREHGVPGVAEIRIPMSLLRSLIIGGLAVGIAADCGSAGGRPPARAPGGVGAVAGAVFHAGSLLVMDTQYLLSRSSSRAQCIVLFGAVVVEIHPGRGGDTAFYAGADFE